MVSFFYHGTALVFILFVCSNFANVSPILSSRNIHHLQFIKYFWFSSVCAVQSLETLYLIYVIFISLVVTSGQAREQQGCLTDIFLLFTGPAHGGLDWWQSCGVVWCGSDIVSGDHVWSPGTAA